MPIISRWVTLLLLIIAALICYSVGFLQGARVLIILGVIFECAFWVGIFKSSSATTSPK